MVMSIVTFLNTVDLLTSKSPGTLLNALPTLLTIFNDLPRKLIIDACQQMSQLINKTDKRTTKRTT